MKKSYITPATSIYHVEMQNPLLNLSVNNKELDYNASNQGWVKSDRSSRGSYSVWDDDWQNQ